MCYVVKTEGAFGSLFLTKNIDKSKENKHRGGDAIMLTLEGLIAVIGLCISIYSLGYTNGKRDTKKQPPKRPN
ncbi:MAG TPA: hypothetical protein DCW90_10165 [Lachnospiraceae bacterium]|nr:hypothetical protein [Lachnospiraceae bacterium]